MLRCCAAMTCGLRCAPMPRIVGRQNACQAVRQRELPRTRIVIRTLSLGRTPASLQQAEQAYFCAEVRCVAAKYARAFASSKLRPSA